MQIVRRARDFVRQQQEAAEARREARVTELLADTRRTEVARRDERERLTRRHEIVTRAVQDFFAWVDEAVPGWRDRLMTAARIEVSMQGMLPGQGSYGFSVLCMGVEPMSEEWRWINDVMREASPGEADPELHALTAPFPPMGEMIIPIEALREAREDGIVGWHVCQLLAGE